METRWEMFSSRLAHVGGALLLIASAMCASCTGPQTLNPGQGNDNGQSSTPGDNNTGGSSNGGGSSVGGVVVTDDPFGSNSDDGRAFPEALRARIRNETPLRADMTVRFVEGESIVHLAFVRVLGETVTTVSSPEMAEQIDISGVDETGRALSDSSFQLGVDYDKQRPAEYVISSATTGPGGEPGPDDDEPGHSVPLSITLFSPSEDSAVTIGSPFQVRWRDEGGSAGSVVRVFLTSTTSGVNAPRIPVGPAIGAALDGLNDELTFVVQGIAPGAYLVTVEMTDGQRVAASNAPGQLMAMADPDNVAPTLAIRSPRTVLEVDSRGLVPVEWTDEDRDSNATITFSLEPSDAVGVSTGMFLISPPLAEDPDGPQFDRAVLPIDGVLPGRYDLVATIDDGELVGTARVPRIVVVTPDPANDPPTLRLFEPAANKSVPVDGAFRVRWDDTDANDNSRISLFLDPDLGTAAFDGDERLLVSALSEDVDGDGDQIQIGLPDGTPTGTYRVAGVISDGITEVVAAAPGLLTITEIEPSRDDEESPRPLRSIAIVEPATSLKLRLGATLPLRIDYSNVPTTTPVRVLLSSINDRGQAFRVDITPSDFRPNTQISLRLPTTNDTIPNKWWPRRFRLSAEVLFEGHRLSASSPEEIWIRQEVEIADVRMVNYFCDDEALAEYESTAFFGIEMHWYGGGFDTGGSPTSATAVLDERTLVRFWATLDGSVPEDLKGDTTHRMYLEAPPSPNMIQVARVDYATLIGLDYAVDPTLPPAPIEADLVSGLYAIAAAAESLEFGKIVTRNSQNLVEVCFPPPSPPKPPQP